MRYEDEEQGLARRNEPRSEERPRRETLMERRLRVSRGEQVDDEEFEEDNDRFDSSGYPPRYVAGPASGGCAQAALYSVLAIITVVLLGLLVGRQVMDALGRNITQGLPEQVQQVIATPTPTLRDWGGTILQIQALNRLETQRFSVERVIEAGTQTGDWRDMLLGDRLLLIASGDVIAGVDLSRLRSSDINISPDGKRITLRLPPSEIFSAALNNDRTRVYDRDTKLVTRLTDGQDPSLETQARQSAESEILKAACENGIMQRSADEAKRAMEQFLQLLEFESVEVIVSPGQCIAPSATQTP